MLINTLCAAAPEGSAVLFGGANLNEWVSMDGHAPGWRVANGAIEVVPGAGDIVTKQLFEDHFLHLEFMLSDMPEATGQGKSNSGVFLQGRYEVQVLDSSAWGSAGTGACGAVYDQFAPLTNACRPALEWQAYDIFFRAPRCRGDEVVEHARITMLHNGVIIHNNTQLKGMTGAPSDTNLHLPGHLRLQDHSNTIWYRNIWAVHLPKSGALQYGEA